MGAFAGSSPLGVLIGAILAAEGKLASGICNALGAGTVLYIASEVRCLAPLAFVRALLLPLFG